MIDNSCDHARELMAAAWTGELGTSVRVELRHHLAGCPACAADMASLSAMWEKLGELPAPEPGLALRARWEETLGSLGSSQSGPHRAWWRNIWPANPAWQATIAALSLALGLAAGVFLERGQRESDEVARLREEVASTKEMVALSMLQQQSAAERLRGIDYSERMSTFEPRVVAALIDTVNRDPNVNVRLAAVDALGKVAGDTRVRASLRQALTQQDSPMVQAALIDYLLDARERNALGVLRDLAARPGLNPTVRERATYAVHQLAQ